MKSPLAWAAGLVGVLGTAGATILLVMGFVGQWSYVGLMAIVSILGLWLVYLDALNTY